MSSQIHLFGEMDLDVSKEPKQIYKKACDISQCCGYVTSMTEGSNKDKGSIDINGEDCQDSLIVTNRLYYEANKITKIQKLVYRIGKYEYNKNNDKLIQVFEHSQNNLKESWDKEQWIKVYPNE